MWGLPDIRLDNEKMRSGHWQAANRCPLCLAHQIDIGAELLGHLYRLAGVAGVRHGPLDRGRNGLMSLAHRKVVREAPVSRRTARCASIRFAPSGPAILTRVTRPPSTMRPVIAVPRRMGIFSRAPPAAYFLTLRCRSRPAFARDLVSHARREPQRRRLAFPGALRERQVHEFPELTGMGGKP